MKRFLPVFLALFSSVAFGSIYVRQHAADIQPGKKIEADDLNDEFNAIATAVNSINGDNVVNGSLGVNAFAATSSAVSLNKKTGCDFSMLSDVTGVKSVNIKPPCEVFIDGTRGFITATQSINLLTNQDGFAPGFATFYYIYASRNSSSLSFQFSATPPTLATTRKSTNSNAKYVGTVRTCDATTDLVSVTREGANQFAFGTCGASGFAVASTNLVSISSGSAGANLSTVVPNTFQSVQLKYSAYVGPFPAQCQFNFGPGTGEEAQFFQATFAATGNATGLMPGFYPPTSLTVTNVVNCGAGGQVRVVRWQEPTGLHQ